MFPLYHNSVFITEKDSFIILEIVAVAISDSALELWFWQHLAAKLSSFVSVTSLHSE